MTPGFSSPPGSPMRPKLEEFDKRPENIFDKLCCEIDFPSDVSTTASDEKQPSATDYPSNNVSFRSPPSPETLKPRTKRLSTSECYQRISRKTCNGLEGSQCCTFSNLIPGKLIFYNNFSSVLCC